MALRLAALALPLLALPAFAGFGVDVRPEAVAYLKKKAAKGNRPAAEAAAFLEAHPETKLFAVRADEFDEKWRGKWEQRTGSYDLKFDTIFLVESRGEGIVVRGDDNKFKAELVEPFFAVRAPALIHEASHAAVAKELKAPITGVLEDELLAWKREGAYLHHEKHVVTPEVKRTVELFRRLNVLGTEHPSFGVLSEQYASDVDRLGRTNVHLGMIVGQYRAGPRALARYVRFLYPRSKGFWSIHGRPEGGIHFAQRELESAQSETLKELATIKLGFWGDEKRVARARAYFRKALPDYADVRWPGQE